MSTKSMNPLTSRAYAIAGVLKQREETVAVAESSAGGLISAALLAVPGASAYYLGGAVAYTRKAREALLQIPASALKGITPSTGAYALLLARTTRERLGATWGIAETGTAGPTGSRYGFDAGRVSVAVSGPIEKTVVLETGSNDREENMQAFAAAALELMEQVLAGKK